MNLWHIVRKGKPEGPFTLVQLKEKIKSGELTATDLVCPDGGIPTMANRVEGLFQAASKPASAKPEVDAAPKAKPAAGKKPARQRADAEHGNDAAGPAAARRAAPAERDDETARSTPEDAVFGMSRLVYWSAMLGGWSALIGWGIAELLIGRWVNENVFLAVGMIILVATTLGAGLSQATGLIAFQGARQLMLLAPGLLGGFIGGVVGGILGNLVFYWVGDRFVVLSVVSRVLGWTLLGIAIGVSEGVLERSWRKIRNGLIGGTLGGFLGGLVFDPVSHVIGSPASSRAFAFVAVGLCIGLFLSLVEVLLKEAWLTVEAGFRPGRQLILKQDVTTMGTSEKAGLIFIAYGAKGVEPTHVSIQRQENGSFTLSDCKSRTGTLLNGKEVREPTMLRDGDLIEFGVNKVRFNLSARPRMD